MDRAIALRLESSVTNVLIDRVPNAITELLDSPTTQLASTIMDLQQTTDNLRGTATSISGTADEFVDSTNASWNTSPL